MLIFMAISICNNTIFSFKRFFMQIYSDLQTSREQGKDDELGGESVDSYAILWSVARSSTRGGNDNCSCEAAIRHSVQNL